MITIRRISRVVLALCICVGMGACQSHQERFDALYNRVTTESEAEKYGPRFREFLPEIVERIDKDTVYKVGTILGSWDAFECAVELEPYLAKETGARRLYIAWIIASFSHGNCPAAIKVLFGTSPDPLGVELRGEYERHLKMRGEDWMIMDAKRFGYALEAWRVMSLQDRWGKICGQAKVGRRDVHS